MSQAVRIQTGARLHFGLLAAQATTGRNFGGVGLMAAALGCELSVARADRDVIVATDDLSPRLAEWLARYRERCPATACPPACQISVTRPLPTHCGLGSGTQTALALAKALSLLIGESNVSATELARRVGRGTRSALGIHGFEQGGLLVESGKLVANEISPLVARLEFPCRWRILLIAPRDRCGLSGDAERGAFARLGPMPVVTTERLCRITLMELLPAVLAEDFETASAALFDFGRLNGEYFAPVQGGLLADQRLGEFANWLRERGCLGVGQSSWGPTLFALCRDDSEAQSRRNELLADRRFDSLDCTITAARNRGADVEQTPN